MFSLLALTLLCGLPIALAISEFDALNCIPRKSVLYHNGHMKLFREDGVWNYSTMLLREDLGVLVLGAREAIYALDVNDISIKKAEVYWRVTEEKQRECKYKGKHADIECRNYIRTLHKMNDTKMYVCGTNAFSPTCDYMTYSDGRLKLEDMQEEGKGKCPFDPFQRYSSIMVGRDLYSATSMNFLGSEPVVLRSSSTLLRTEFKSSWLNEPNFIYMDLVPESEDSTEGDDDKVYLFFSENAMEYDFYNKLMVSRIARVCKGDMGGQRTLQRKWTSFLKARLDCSVPEPSLPYLVQDVYLLRHRDWRKSVFYAVFTPQSGSSELSAVCAYSVVAVGDVFKEGKYKTPVTVETSHVKWVMYSGELPVPRPGACVNNAARSLGMERSLDLPDKTLQFIRDRPLMDEVVRPLGGGPLLVKRGAVFTRIVVDRVLALDTRTYPVMFIENGFVQKAVNYDGEMFIIEEVQLFQSPEPVKILRLSSTTGQLYAGSEFSAVQMPLSDCGRYTSCLDCVLARDPYCAWDLTADHCSSLTTGPAHSHTNMVQSLKDGDASLCPNSVTVKPKNFTLVPGNIIKLQCQPSSNLARVHWRFAGQPLPPSDTKYYIYSGGLLILNTSAADAGQYACESVERVNGRHYPSTVAIYQLQPRPNTDKEEGGGATGGDSEGTKSPHVKNTLFPDIGDVTEEARPPESRSKEGRLLALQVAVALLSVLTLALLGWNICRGQPPLPGCCGVRGSRAERTRGASRDFTPCAGGCQTKGGCSERTLLDSASSYSANNNHAVISFTRNGEHKAPNAFTSAINDESEI